MAAAASVAALAVNGAVRMAGTTSQAYLERSRMKDPMDLIADMCRQLCNHGWVSGTGGSITLKVHDDSIPKHQQLIVMSRSGVQNERMVSEDMYVISPNGSILSAPLAKPYSHSHKPPKCSDCAPLFMKIEAYPKTTAVLVRNHGIYLWGDSWISAKTKAECYHYLFDAAIRIHKLGMYWSTPAYGPFPSFSGLLGGDRSTLIPAKAGSLTSNNSIEPAPRCIVLDIEGTTTPISFVSDVLFPYAHDNVGRHLDTTYDSKETQDDIVLLRSQILDDLEQGVDGAVPIPSDEAGKEEVIAALVTNVEAMISADRKITALKQLQGHIWQTGFQNNELEGVVFDDVPEALEKWHALGIKVYIYSSGSRLAQRLIFGKTNYGDLRKYLCGFFDTTVGNKKETSSYIQISEFLGVDEPSEVLFVTDVLQEAGSAKAAGLEVIISIRPGNGPLPERHGFKTVKSFSEI